MTRKIKKEPEGANKYYNTKDTKDALEWRKEL